MDVCPILTPPGAGLREDLDALTETVTTPQFLTYRKRAYARLQISSHNELLRFFFAACPAVGLEDSPRQPWHIPVQASETLWRN